MLLQSDSGEFLFAHAVCLLCVYVYNENQRDPRRPNVYRGGWRDLLHEILAQYT